MRNISFPFLARLIALAISLGIALPFALAQSQSATIAPSPDDGFITIFDGQSLNGWEGDPKYWRVENGALVGEVTPETLLKQNSFIIWRAGTTRDFELKLEYRVTAKGNSGINYRSTEIEGQKWAMRGYQADIDGADRYTGQNYEEKGRTFLAKRGEAVTINSSAKPAVIASLGEAPQLASFIKKEDWNEVHLIARGHVLTHIVNGHVMSVVIDDDAAHRRSEGLLGVQVHVGPPMKIEYRNIRLKNL
ncbi:MAG: DUF1080 domain-containing protein [Nibricoccus sp.]